MFQLRPPVEYKPSAPNTDPVAIAIGTETAAEKAKAAPPVTTLSAPVQATLIPPFLTA